jgi:(hydroxyamino)benzene mutase
MGGEGGRSQRLVFFGFLLFLLGLLTGFAIPSFANPRMGMSSHIAGVLNGMFLVVLGLAWDRIRLPAAASRALFALALYGTFANWIGTGLAASFGTKSLTPFAAGPGGTPFQEGLVVAVLVSLGLAMVSVCVLTLWGLRRKEG